MMRDAEAELLRQKTARPGCPPAATGRRAYKLIGHLGAPARVAPIREPACLQRLQDIPDIWHAH